MSTGKTIKISSATHKRLLQHKVTTDARSFDRAIEQLLDEVNHVR
jgi:hypothetical protein